MVTKCELVLEVLLCGLDLATRRDLGWILMGRHEPRSVRQLDQLLARWRREKLLVRHGRGADATFSLTEAGRKRVVRPSPAEHWDRAWDGRWRAFLFDLPSTERKKRMLLWRSLRAQRFGLLQRSVWIWPHEAEPILQRMLQTQGIPESFCGLAADRVFLCTNAEIVGSAWDFAAIDQQHRTYLDHPVLTPASVKRAGDLQKLAHLAHLESRAFGDAFCFDPLLPRVLWPENYRGPEVVHRRHHLRALLAARARELAGS